MRPVVRRSVVSTVAAAVALAVAACGAGSSTTSAAGGSSAAGSGSTTLVADGSSAAGATSAAATMSAGTYRMKLTAACVADSRATVLLPVEQQREHLTFAQLERRAQAIQGRFVSAVAALRPPRALRADQQLLLALGRHSGPRHPTRAQAIAAAERARTVYRSIGVPVCAKQMSRAIAQLQGSEPG